MSEESADGASLVARRRINRAKPFGHRRPGSRRDVTPQSPAAAPGGEARSTDGVTFAASPGTPHRSHSRSVRHTACSICHRRTEPVWPRGSLEAAELDQEPDRADNRHKHN